MTVWWRTGQDGWAGGAGDQLGSRRRPDTTRETSPHRSRLGDFWAGKPRRRPRVDCGKGGDAESEGRMQASPLREKLGEGEPLPRWRRWERRMWPGCPTRPPRCHGREGTVSGSPWRRLAEEPGLLFWVAVLLRTRQAPLSVPHNPAGQGGGQTSGSPGKAQPRGQPGPRATNRSVFVSPHRLRQPWGCLPGKRGAGVGTPSHLLQNRPLPGILGREGGAHSVNHEASLSLCLCGILSPTSGCREERAAARSPHFRPLSLFSLASFCSWGPFFWRMRTHGPPRKSSQSPW